MVVLVIREVAVRVIAVNVVAIPGVVCAAQGAVRLPENTSRLLARILTPREDASTDKVANLDTSARRVALMAMALPGAGDGVRTIIYNGMTENRDDMVVEASK